MANTPAPSGVSETTPASGWTNTTAMTEAEEAALEARLDAAPAFA